MAGKQKGCVATAQGPIVAQEAATETQETHEEVKTMSVSVGMKAPDFEATAYVDGDFDVIKLSDFAGKWVSLCFYPGDFTFV